MKSLYESILDSDESAKNIVDIHFVQNLIKKPIKNQIDLFNSIWNKLGLSYDAGYGKGKWIWSSEFNYYAYVVTIKSRESRTIRDETIAYCDYTENFGSHRHHNILIFKAYSPKTLLNWAEKISNILNMKITNGLTIYLDF